MSRWRPAKQAQCDLGVEVRHSDICHERDRNRDRRHADPDLYENMGRDRRADGKPPLVMIHEDQGREEDGIGRPKGREDIVRQGAD